MKDKFKCVYASTRHQEVPLFLCIFFHANHRYHRHQRDAAVGHRSSSSSFLSSLTRAQRRNNNAELTIRKVEQRARTGYGQV